MSREKSLISQINSHSFFLGAVAVPGCPRSPLERARQVFAEVGAAGVPSGRRNCTSCQTFAQKACWLHNPPPARHSHRQRASRHFGKQLLVTGSKTPVYPGCFSGCAACCPTGWWAFCECGPGRWWLAVAGRVGRDWPGSGARPMPGPASLPRVGATTCAAARGVEPALVIATCGNTSAN